MARISPARCEGWRRAIRRAPPGETPPPQGDCIAVCNALLSESYYPTAVGSGSCGVCCGCTTNIGGSMRRLADQSRALLGGHRKPVLAGMVRRGVLRTGLAMAASVALVGSVTLAGPANASPTRHTARYTFTPEKDSWPAPGARSANRVIAYVVNGDSGTVTPISTAPTPPARRSQSGTASEPSRSRRMGRPSTSSTAGTG